MITDIAELNGRLERLLPHDILSQCMEREDDADQMRHYKAQTERFSLQLLHDLKCFQDAVQRHSLTNEILELSVTKGMVMAMLQLLDLFGFEFKLSKDLVDRGVARLEAWGTGTIELRDGVGSFRSHEVAGFLRHGLSKTGTATVKTLAQVLLADEWEAPDVPTEKIVPAAEVDPVERLDLDEQAAVMRVRAGNALKSTGAGEDVIARALDDNDNAAIAMNATNDAFIGDVLAKASQAIAEDRATAAAEAAANEENKGGE